MSDIFNNVRVLSDKELVLQRPGINIGSVDETSLVTWVVAENGETMMRKTITLVPALLKLFDEAIVNCRDHAVRMSNKIAQGIPNALPVSYIRVNVSDTDGTVAFVNDGNGMDIVKHPDVPDVWTPEVAFAHLRSSTHYDTADTPVDPNDTYGGQNGLGIKLAFIWSVYGRVETVDHIRRLKYVQEYSHNLDTISPPVITSVAAKTKPYTKIVFRPDYARLNATFGEDTLALFRRRVYDIAAVTDKSVKVYYNDTLLPVRTFHQYVDMFLGDKTSCKRVAGTSENGRWDYVVALSPIGEFAQVSFVNGIHTSKGGKHVDYIVDQITSKAIAYIEKKKKIRVSHASVRDHLMVFVRCDITRPAFDSQTKETLTTPVAAFRAEATGCSIGDDVVEKIIKTLGVMDTICLIAQAKETRKAERQANGNKSRVIHGIPKLEDANYAGTAQSQQCTLILCEGDSAKTAVISGLTYEDRNYIGVFPLKGKLMNVRDKKSAEICNDEIVDIIKILGLEFGKTYTDTATLRYGHVAFLTDQDVDGSHIKGLGINLFHSQWRSLTLIPGFIGFMNTPILKARKGASEVVFYSEGEYNKWKQTTPSAGWTVKYYKGLGTSSKAEFMEYMRRKKIVGFAHTGEPSDDAIDMVFNKSRADDRKRWLETTYHREVYLDTAADNVSYDEFVNRELIHFSKYDCERSIPSVVDGLKPSLRKILYAAFKRDLTTELKVAQFSGYVSETSGYHHGEESLNRAIIGMAQNFVGSNNINLLFPSGQFGTRFANGHDSASPRYIFTRLETIARVLFPKVDDSVITYLEDDGALVEPLYYVPILPMVLVNGATGIGTGSRTDIPAYNPLDIARYLRQRLTDNARPPAPFQALPYYEGFKGTVEVAPTDADKFIITGVYTHVNGKDDTICVTELPVGTCINDFKKIVDDLSAPRSSAVKKTAGKSAPSKPTAEAPIIKSYQMNNTDTCICAVVQFAKDALATLESTTDAYGRNGVHKLLKLATVGSLGNMNLFNASDVLSNYANVGEIMDAYFDVRLACYEKRRVYQIQKLEEEMSILANKTRFVQEIVDGTLDVRNMPDDAVNALMAEHKYRPENGGYDYLLEIKLRALTRENIIRLKDAYRKKTEDLAEIKRSTPEQLWLRDLDVFDDCFQTYKERRITALNGDIVEPKKVRKVGSDKKRK